MGLQWALAAWFVFFAVFRFVVAAVAYRAPAVRSLVHRGTSFRIGLYFLINAIALISPALPLTILHERSVVPVVAILLILMLILQYVAYDYGDGISVVLGALLLAVAVLRGWPCAFYT